MTFAWLIAYSRVALGTDQGRLLFPAIAPLALLLIGGLAQWLPRAWREHETRWLAGWTGFMGVIALLALVAGLWLPYAPPAAPDAAEVAAASPVGEGFGEQIELAGYRWDAAQSGDESRRLILYWRASRPINTDLRTSLRLLNERGEVIWEWKRSPGAGRFSTDRWPADRLVADVYHVPILRLSEAKGVEIGVRPFPEGPWLARKDNSPSLVLSKP